MRTYDAIKTYKRLAEEFPDWHVGDGDEAWSVSPDTEVLTSYQLEIVKRNVELLLNRGRWAKVAGAFENVLLNVPNEAERKAIRLNFVIHFDDAEFSSELPSFENYNFPCGVSFKRATFGDGDVSFAGAKFGVGVVSFRDACFHRGDVFFDHVDFGIGNVSFYSTAFGQGEVSFEKSKFEEGYISFVYAEIEKGSIAFDDTILKGVLISFDGVNIKQGDAWFDSITFLNSSISFSYMTVAGNLYARWSNYFEQIEFRCLSVDGMADFSESVFHEVPDFTDSKFGRPPDVSGMEILAFKKAWIRPWWKADKDEGAKFRKLKAMALAASDHEKDGEFFAYEMLAKRGYEAGSSGLVPLFINWLYFTLSNFGQSYVRPAIALGLNFFIFFVINAITAASFLKPTDLSSFAFWQSFKNMIPFLNSLVRFASRPDEFKTVYELAFNQLQTKGAPIEFFINAGIFQNFIGLVLLFLLLLGLRNKFRLK